MIMMMIMIMMVMMMMMMVMMMMMRKRQKRKNMRTMQVGKKEKKTEIMTKNTTMLYPGNVGESETKEEGGSDDFKPMQTNGF